GVVHVVDIQAPAAQTARPVIPDTEAGLPLLPERDFLTSKVARDRHTREQGKGLLELCWRLVDRSVDIPDADGRDLFTLQRPAVGILAVPRERGALVRRGRELLREASACN